ncbi:MAG: isoleucine--tRNA ligase [Candidatus Thermoplasmatota archaeon]|nr:isoleucine--tRNA ligase [Candidatus Thermoplasmatota archaeon]
MVFSPIEAGKNQKDIGNEVLSYWNQQGVYRTINDIRKNGKDFIFLEGPPTANGVPHVGHALTRAIKDTVLRYKTMMGYNIKRRDAGWDCHGLPVELEAEKKFGFKNKADIERYGVDKFNEYCRGSVFKYVEEWLEVDDKLGFWIDHDNAYVTLKKDYMESEWWALKSLFEKGILYKDYRISPYCPRCGTTLSSHELAQGYKDTKDLSVYAKFRLDDGRFVLAWTTTPWTLPSNMFLAVNENVDYCEVSFNKESYIVAENLAKPIFQGNFEIKRTFKGKELIGLKYTRPIEFVELPENACVIVHGDHVTLGEGTGIVHTAPAFGSEDFEIGKQRKVKIINPVNLQGKFEYESMPWNGLSVKDADLEIVKFLKERNMALKSEKYEHSYPFCYRCGTPLLYYPIDAWFLGVSSFRKELVANNEKINWVPAHIKSGRFGNFIEEAKDWNLSRNRYWGTPLPVWTCKNNHMKAIGSVEELKKLGVEAELNDLHRPYVDNVKFKCDKCGEIMEREPYVIDTWFDSGSATYAATHYPFNGEKKPDIPVSFVTEGIDQTRGWFYTLHVISTLLFGSNAYENVFCAEFILDSQGRKMSKSKGNGVLAKELIEKYGPDPSRLFFYTTVPWKPKPLVDKVVKEAETKILGTLLNIYTFFASNANLDNYDFKGLTQSDNDLDRWLVSRVNTTIASVRNSMDVYEFSQAQSLIGDLIDDTSNFYLRLSRRRFWENSNGGKKEDAYSTLYFALESICKMLAPIAPFTTEFIYRKLNPDALSVHAELFPEVSYSLIDQNLENEMAVSRKVLEAVRRGRQVASIKGRQPLKEILIEGSNVAEKTLVPVREEINCANIKFINEAEKPVKTYLRPVLGKVAPVLKEKMKEFNNFIQEINDSGEAKSFSKGTGISFEGYELPEGSVEILEEVSPNYTMVCEETFNLYINNELDHGLEVQGMAREIIRRIQVMRKEMDLPYDQHILVQMDGDELVKEAVHELEKTIRSETLSDKLEISKTFRENGNSISKNWNIDGRELMLMISKN